MSEGGRSRPTRRRFRFAAWQVAFGLVVGMAVAGIPWLLRDVPSNVRQGGDIMPDVAFLPAASLKSSGCEGANNCLPARAIYVPAEHRIYLRDGWTAENFDDLAVLLHEFVHHLQTIGKLRFACDTEIELPAYALQEAFYKAHKRSPDGHVLSDFTRFTRYSCLANE